MIIKFAILVLIVQFIAGVCLALLETCYDLEDILKDIDFEEADDDEEKKREIVQMFFNRFPEFFSRALKSFLISDIIITIIACIIFN